jgi:hypothetical protein
MSNELSHASILEGCGKFQDPTEQGSLFVNMTTKVIKVKLKRDKNCFILYKACNVTCSHKFKSKATGYNDFCFQFFVKNIPERLAKFSKL